MTLLEDRNGSKTPKYPRLRASEGNDSLHSITHGNENTLNLESQLLIP